MKIVKMDSKVNLFEKLFDIIFRLMNEQEVLPIINLYVGIYVFMYVLMYVLLNTVMIVIPLGLHKFLTKCSS